MAAGVFEGFSELSLGPWDVAGGALLIREAGGVVTDWVGREDGFLTSGNILAGPPGVHEELCRSPPPRPSTCQPPDAIRAAPSSELSGS